jgi:hypothetical protein
MEGVRELKAETVNNRTLSSYQITMKGKNHGN